MRRHTTSLNIESRFSPVVGSNLGQAPMDIYRKMCISITFFINDAIFLMILLVVWAVLYFDLNTIVIRLILICYRVGRLPVSLKERERHQRLRNLVSG